MADPIDRNLRQNDRMTGTHMLGPSYNIYGQAISHNSPLNLWLHWAAGEKRSALVGSKGHISMDNALISIHCSKVLSNALQFSCLAIATLVTMSMRRRDPASLLLLLSMPIDLDAMNLIQNCRH